MNIDCLKLLIILKNVILSVHRELALNLNYFELALILD